MKITEKSMKCKYVSRVLCSIAVLTLLDQVTKLLAVSFLKDHDSVSLIAHVLEFSYLENRGMAFGLMQGKLSFFLIQCLLFFAAVAYCFLRMPASRFYSPLWIALSVVTAGALGNFLDRLLRGYVVDFIYFRLIDFPVFNVADIFVSCGCISLVLLLFFKYKDEDFSFLRLRK
jgi:signal peptidase II